MWVLVGGSVGVELSDSLPAWSSSRSSSHCMSRSRRRNIRRRSRRRNSSLSRRSILIFSLRLSRRSSIRPTRTLPSE